MNGEPHHVVVTDIHMSFFSMVGFMVKWAFAAIPAILIIWFFIVAFGTITGSAIDFIKADQTQSKLDSKPANAITQNRQRKSP